VESVRLAKPEDAAEVGRVFAAGFREDPVMCWVFSEPDRDRKIATMFGFLAAEALVPLGATYMLAGSCAGWTPPDTPEWPPERGERFAGLMAEVATDADMERLGVFGATSHRLRPTTSHWYLSVIATDDSMRGQGLGSSLLTATLRMVDRERTAAYLESTNPRNVSLYLRHGFVVVEQARLPDGPVVTGMWRDSHESAENTGE
jgi:ribosomal protein S18 acetylase RimI-like enzyme